MVIEEGAAPVVQRNRGPLLLLGAFMLAAALLFVALRLGGAIVAGEPTAFDRAVLLALRHPAEPTVAIGPFWLRKAMVEITSLGSGAILTLIVIIAAGLLIVRRAPRTALLLVAATASGGIVVTLLKERFARPRPTLVEHFVQVQSASFPSAHAANSAVVFLTLGTLLTRPGASRAERRYTLTVAVLLTILVGISRVYLGVHWPSDVAGGWMLGSGWAMLWCALGAALPGSERSGER